MFSITTYICIFTIISRCSGSNNLPTFVKTCKRFDPNISECMKSNIERIRGYSDIAFPEFNISRLDPWKSPSKIIISKGTFSTNVTNIVFTGSKQFKVTGISVRLRSNFIGLKLLFPKIRHNCTVASKGRFLIFKLGKQGYVAGYSDLALCMKFKGERLFKNGKEHINFNDIVVTAKGKNFYAEPLGLVEGDPAAISAFRTILIDYVDIFLPIYNYLVEKSIGNDIANVVINVYEAYPLDDLHPLK